MTAVTILVRVIARRPQADAAISCRHSAGCDRASRRQLVIEVAPVGIHAGNKIMSHEIASLRSQ
jgi:hypothetical protein